MSQEDDNHSQLPAESENVKTITKKSRENIFNVTRKRELLKTMKETGSKKTACAAVGITPAHLDKIMARDHELYKRFKIAEAKYLGELEKEAKRRAMQGVVKDVYYKGEVVGEQVEYSDDLLKMLLKAADKDKYGTKSTIENNHNYNAKDQELRSKLATQLGVKLEESPKPIEDDILEGEYTEG